MLSLPSNLRNRSTETREKTKSDPIFLTQIHLIDMTMVFLSIRKRARERESRHDFLLIFFEQIEKHY